jgi:hypothetical protein
VLAGHPELIYYTLLWRARTAWCGCWRPTRASGGRRCAGAAPRTALTRILKLAGWLLTMAVLGVALGAVQLLPLVELLPLNFREGSASLAQVRDVGVAEPPRADLWLPNVFGSPSHHQWFDIWARQWTPATVNALGEPVHTIFWGIKNYVEGGAYLGLATWLLAAVAAVAAARGSYGQKGDRRVETGE